MPSREDVNSSLCTLLSSFENALNKHVPLKTLSKRQDVLETSHGLQKDCFNQLGQKTSCIPIYADNLFKTTTNGINFNNGLHFGRYRNKLNHLIEKSKVSYYSICNRLKLVITIRP